MPQVSIIIPVYNKEAYLEASLQSVLTQSFQDFEIIVVNDGSTDHSLDILDRIAAGDSRIRIFSIPNNGVSNARNVGLSHAGGKWIQFLDADDLLAPGYLQQAMELLQNNPAEILFTGFTMTDADLVPIREIRCPESGFLDYPALCSSFIRHQYTTGFYGYISNKLFLRTLWEKSGALFPVGVTLAEDLAFYVKLYATVRSAYYCSCNSFLYRQTAGNYIHNENINYYDQMRIHESIKQWYQDSGLYPKFRTELDAKISQYAYFILFHNSRTAEDRSFAFRFLSRNMHIMESIIPACLQGFPRLILFLLKRKCRHGISVLLCIRNYIKSLYRAVIKHESLLHL